jgi:hypothetical protein
MADIVVVTMADTTGDIEPAITMGIVADTIVPATEWAQRQRGLR